MSMIGIIDNIYPNIYSIGFIGLIPNLTNNDVVLSLLINIAVNNPKKNVVTFSEVVSSLNSRLGIQKFGLRLFFKRAARNCGFDVPVNKTSFELRDDND